MSLHVMHSLAHASCRSQLLAMTMMTILYRRSVTEAVLWPQLFCAKMQTSQCGHVVVYAVLHQHDKMCETVSTMELEQTAVILLSLQRLAIVPNQRHMTEVCMVGIEHSCISWTIPDARGFPERAQKRPPWLLEHIVFLFFLMRHLGKCSFS